MNQETNEGISYLKALRQATGSQAASAAAPARNVPPEAQAAPLAAENSGQQFQGSEKRRSPRYKCEGSAEIREDGRDVRTWATFTDVSIHGCYLEAQATYPAGTLLSMKLEANGIRLETKGSVRVNYPYLGMGIAFLAMSEETQASLRRMLATITRPSVIMGPGIASSLPSSCPLDAVPLVTDPAAAIQELVDFFENRQMLMRDDFLRILKKSQSAEQKP
jgi:PilZ domain-containing protein